MCYVLSEKCQKMNGWIINKLNILKFTVFKDFFKTENSHFHVTGQRSKSSHCSFYPLNQVSISNSSQHHVHTSIDVLLIISQVHLTNCVFFALHNVTYYYLTQQYSSAFVSLEFISDAE